MEDEKYEDEKGDILSFKAARISTVARASPTFRLSMTPDSTYNFIKASKNECAYAALVSSVCIAYTAP